MGKKQDKLAGVIAASAGLYEYPGEDPSRSAFWTDHERAMQNPEYRAAFMEANDPYVEEADANPERSANGCMIYKVGA